MTRSLKLSLGAALLGVAALTSIGVATASPQGGPGMMGLHAGWGGGHAMNRMLDRVDATPEQRARISAILDAAKTERRAQFDSARQTRQQMVALLAQPTIDANAAEALRQQQMAQADVASKRMLQTMLQVAEVLSPEQRKQLADYMAQRREMMQRHRQEMRGIDTPTR